MSNARELAELGGSYGQGGFVGMKNRIINGAMMIDQRNAGASLTPSTGFVYNVDRFCTYVSQASKLSVQQNAGSVTPPAGFKKYVGVTSLSAFSPASSDQFMFGQLIEGFNVADLGFGTADAKTVTLSFWVRSSLTGQFSATLENQLGTQSYVATYTISAANTWQYITLTIPGSTTGTWATDNTNGMYVLWNLGNGTNTQTTPNTWYAGGANAATGDVKIIGTSGATFYITGVQLEKGSTATSFDLRPYGTELNLCYRYYWKNAPASPYVALATGPQEGTWIDLFIQYPVAMRSTPTLSVSGGIVLYGTNAGTIRTQYNGLQTAMLQLNTTSSSASGTANSWICDSGGAGNLQVSAEL